MAEDGYDQMDAWMEGYIEDFLKKPTPIKNNSILSAPNSSIFGEQSIYYKDQDLEDDVNWAKEKFSQLADTKVFLAEACKYIDEKYIGNVKKWNQEYVDTGKDKDTTLAEVKSEEVSSCFHRGIILTHLVNSLGVSGLSANFVSGDWVETDRQKVLGQYDSSKYKYRGSGIAGVKFMEGEPGEAHAFVIVKSDEKYFLADPSLFIKDETQGTRVPVVEEFPKRTVLSREMSVNLPNGKSRHYVFHAMELEVEEVNPQN